MVPLFLLLSLDTAVACEGPTHRTSCHLDERDGQDEDKDDPNAVSVRLGFETTALESPSSRWYAELEGHKESWLRVEARFTTEQRWQGRIGAGVDLFADSPFDLRLGLFLGHVGNWQSPDHHHLAVGTDISLGAEVGRLSGEVRWVGGKRKGGGGIWNETDLSLAWRVLADLRLHGHWLRMRGAEGSDAGVGLGLSYTF